MHPYPKHLSTFDYQGPHRYFLTFCTHERRKVFADANHVKLVEAQFLRTIAEGLFADIAHCFMPDHLHAVVEGRRPDADLRLFVSRAKQFTGFYFQKAFGTRLWQRYGYEHAIRGDETMADVVRYILENPIRAGLARSVEDYPFFGSSEYTIDQLLEFASVTRSSG